MFMTMAQANKGVPKVDVNVGLYVCVCVRVCMFVCVFLERVGVHPKMHGHKESFKDLNEKIHDIKNTCLLLYQLS